MEPNAENQGLPPIQPPIDQESTPNNLGGGPIRKSLIKSVLWVLVPLTLALAVVAGITTMRNPNWAWVSTPATVILSLVVLVLGCVRLGEIRTLQQTGLRVSQIVVGLALLFLFVVAVGLFFFVSCAMNFTLQMH